MVLYVDEVHTEMPVPTEMPSPSAVHGEFDEEARGSPRVLVLCGMSGAGSSGVWASELRF